MSTVTLLEKADRAMEEFRALLALGLVNKGGEFVPTLMYPPMTQHPPLREEEFFKGYVPPRDNLFTVYLHVPFCIQQCSFCHFPNIITSSDAEKDRYLDAMAREMDLYLKRLGVERLKARSILLGGGTPTYLTPAQLARLLDSLASRFDLDTLTQFSCDLDPLTVIGYEGRERLKILKAHNVTRLAMGVQSFSDDMLRRMSRHHTAADSARAIGQAKEMGFELNIELIYGYPGETVEHWIETVGKALQYDVDEIMIYRLKVIPYGDHTGTITAQHAKDRQMFISNEEQIRLKAAAITLLEENGYHETITRFFSKRPEYYSYYSCDWMGYQCDNIGFGYYAMSMFSDRFAQNTCNLKEYYEAVDGGRLPIARGIVRSRDQQLRRNIVMPLKNRDLSKRQFQQRMGLSVGDVFGRKIALLKEHDLLEEDGETLRPTRKGRFFVDEVTQFFYHPEFLPFPRERYVEGPLNPYLDNVTLVPAS